MTLGTFNVMLQGTIIRNDDFLRATLRCNVGTMLQRFEIFSQKCVALKIVVANRSV